MVADPTADELERLAEENNDWTFCYWRRNGDGLPVRDAKFITDVNDYDVAVLLFASHVKGVEVGLCAVLRGQVETVDDIERADQPVMDSAAYNHLYGLNSTASLHEADPYTVYGSWDTGDGHKRHMQVVQAIDALHAEMLVRADKTEGEFLVAAVVEGCVPTEDEAEVWATVDGEPWPVPQPKRSLWQRVLGR